MYVLVRILVWLLFLTFSILVDNPKEMLYTVANPARGLLDMEKRTKGGTLAARPPPTLLVRKKIKKQK